MITRCLILSLLVAGWLAGIVVAEPLELMKTVDGYRKEVPPPQNLGEMNGFSLKDAAGQDYLLSHLAGVARRLGVKSRTDCLMLLTYLKDPDPKIRFIAAEAIENVVHAYPGGMSLSNILTPNSDGHREMVRRFVAKLQAPPDQP